MRLAATTTIIAGALASVALASPLASARPNLDPTTGQAQPTATAPAAVANHDQQVTHVSLVGPPALPAATRSQQPEVHRLQAAAAHAFAYTPLKSARYSMAALNGYDRASTKRPGVVHLTTHGNAFDWGAAAIGAAGGLVITLLIIGGGVLVAQRRRPNPNRVKALA